MIKTSLYLLKPGELTLKGGNRKEFEKVLRRNLAALLKGSGAQLTNAQGRYYVRCPEEKEDWAEDAFKHLFGISGWAKSRICEKDIDQVLEACIKEARLLYERGIRSFKIEARRTDKTFPLDSYGIRCKAGETVLNAVSGLKVDVHKPQGTIEVEIREKAYVYGNAGGQAQQGLRGLPVGTAGRGMLLLSGGIDSPVAGFLMASRGMRLDAVYFHAYPYTSDEARQKAITLAEILGRYTMGIKLHVINFTPIQLRIKERSPEAWRTILLRMAMMDCAERLARKRGAKCLVTGESLSQVASQTIENISCTQSGLSIPVMRPLIGMDKESIIRTAEKIGTYRTSILPYEDCCVLFTPEHPVIRGKPEEAIQLYEELEADGLIEEALKNATPHKLGMRNEELGV